MDNLCLINSDFVNTLIKKRPKDLHKGDCGKLLIIAGSKGMAGAAILSVKGALRSGAGLVRVSIPEELFPIIQVGVPEATCVSRSLSPEQLEEYQAIAIGPGLGVEVSNVSLIKMVLTQVQGIVILDADALNLISQNSILQESMARSQADIIITPHTGEAARLLGCSTEEINKDRETAVRHLVNKTMAVSILKGPNTLVATKDQKTYINTTGNSGMATGGSGDVLTGIIAALAGQGLSCFGAATAGVYIHGLAGDIAAENLGEYGLTATDIANTVALALKRTIKI